jgi:plastocyanin
MPRLTSLILVGSLVLAIAACSSGAADNRSTAPAASYPPGTPTITAKDIAFTQHEVDAPADTSFTLVFQNVDGAPHNVAIVRDGSSSPAFTGEVITGPREVAYSVPALAPGTYKYLCDVHPDMTGILIAR